MGMVFRGRSRRRAERGQGLIEFAFVAPVLLALVFGIFDFGRGMSANVTVTNSAREGARYLVVNAVPRGALASMSCYGTGASPSAPSSDSAQGKAWRQLGNDGLDLSKVTMTVSFYSSAHDPTSFPPDATYTCSGGSLSPSTSYTASSGAWVRFDVQYVFSPSTPLISQMFSSVTIDQQATMVLE